MIAITSTRRNIADAPTYHIQPIQVTIATALWERRRFCGAESHFPSHVKSDPLLSSHPTTTAVFLFG